MNLSKSIYLAGLIVLSGVSCGKDEAGPTGPGNGITISEAGSLVPSVPGGIPYTEDVFVSGNYAYLADNFTNVATAGWGLVVVNVANPAAPTQSSFIPFSFLNAVFVADGFLYLALPTGLRILNLANPAAPVGEGAYPGVNVYDVHVAGSYAYLTDPNKGLYVINVSNKSAPALAGSFDVPGNAAHGVFVEGSYAYVCDRDSGMYILNVATPSAISQVGRVKVAFADLVWAEHVHVVGNTAYLLGLDGLEAIDVTNKSAPIILGTFVPPGAGFQLHVLGSIAYVAQGDDGVILVDISNPAAMKSLGSYDTPGMASGIFAAGNLIYVADYDEGLRILKTQ